VIPHKEAHISIKVEKIETLSMLPVFGRNLSEIVNSDQPLPLVVAACIDILSSQVETEGIFRESGSHNEIQQLKKLYDTGKSVDLSKTYIHSVAGLLKLFFRELPEPVIPQELNDQIGEIISQKEMMAQVIEEHLLNKQIRSAIKALLLDELAEVNRNIFKNLSYLFKAIVDHQQQNKMSRKNLLTCVVQSIRCHVGLLDCVIEDPNYFWGPRSMKRLPRRKN